MGSSKRRHLRIVASGGRTLGSHQRRAQLAAFVAVATLAGAASLYSPFRHMTPSLSRACEQLALDCFGAMGLANTDDGTCEVTGDYPGAAWRRPELILDSVPEVEAAARGCSLARSLPFVVLPQHQ